MNLSRPVLVLSLAATSFLRASAASNDERAGAAVYAQSGCQHCHTMRQVGGSKGPDLSGVGRRLKKEKIRTQIMQGGHEMPPFGDVLRRSEVDDLVAYLHSCRDKPPK
jgi:mono/diheme cytochrome c family protein